MIVMPYNIVYVMRTAEIKKIFIYFERFSIIKCMATYAGVKCFAFFHSILFRNKIVATVCYIRCTYVRSVHMYFGELIWTSAGARVTLRVAAFSIAQPFTFSNLTHFIPQSYTAILSPFRKSPFRFVV